MRETGMATTPPFRADQVGSLLRPTILQEARARARAGSIAAAELREVQDQAIRAAVAFASTHHGNALTEEEQWRKLERVVEVARDVWGE